MFGRRSIAGPPIMGGAKLYAVGCQGTVIIIGNRCAYYQVARGQVGVDAAGNAGEQ